MSCHSLLLFLAILLFSPPSLQLSSALSTIAVSFASGRTIVCALVLLKKTNYGDTAADDRYTLNCTSISNRTTRNYPAGRAYYAGVAAGDDFLCGLSNKGPSHKTSVMRWWKFPEAAANESDVTVKRLYHNRTLVRLDAGEKHVCGLTREDRRMYCWRWPEFTPPKRTDLVDIAVGGDFVCALSSSGEVTCHSDSDDCDVVAKVPTGVYTIVAAGDTHACAVSTAGRLECWGRGAPAIVDGNGTTNGYAYLALGRNRTCAIRGDNKKVVCWGDGFSVPEKLAQLEFTSITASKGVFCGVQKENLSLSCWGSDELDSDGSTPVFDRVLPGPCVDASCASVVTGSDGLCPTGTRICELEGQKMVAPSHQPTPPPPKATGGGGSDGGARKKLTYMVVGTVSLGLAVSTLLAYLTFRYRKKKRHRVHDSGPLGKIPPPSREDTTPLPTPVKNRPQATPDPRFSELIVRGHNSTIERYPFQMLIDVTDGFSEEQKIGSGGYGSVYRAALNHRDVAIKRAEIPPAHGNRSSEKKNAFLAELAFLSRVNHRNLVRLLGFSQDEMEFVLVYDYMANGSLHDHLHKLPYSPMSSWKARIALALDAARGIEYLHQYAVPAIIHRDIKSSNILLDETWTAKVSDFGLSLVGPDDDTSHISLRAAGTLGYMDPEYYRTQCLTTKSDVYSFGVVLLELLTGRKAIHQEDGDDGGSFDGDPRNVVDFAVPHINNDEVLDVLDPKLPPPPPSEIEAVQQLGYLAADCVMLEGRARPGMTEVVYALETALDACGAGQQLVRSITTRSV